MDRLKAKVGNLKFINPFIPASGCFGYGKEMQEIAPLNEWGAVLSKTLTLEPRAGNPPPRLFETTAGLLNSIGLANPGLSGFLENVLPIYQGGDYPLFISIAGNTRDEYVELARRLLPIERINGLEINISCPNIHQGGLAFGVHEDTVFELISEIRSIWDRELWVKLTPNVTDIRPIARAAIEAGGNALVIANTYTGMAIDIHTQRPVFANIQAGLSGPAIKPLTLLKVFQAYADRPVPIIAVGGICGARDVVEYLLAGACAVQLGTILFRQPAILLGIISELLQYMETYGISELSQLIGNAHTR